MENNNKHTNPENIFKKIDIPFKDSKEEIWDILSDKISDKPQIIPKTKVISMTWLKVAAASIAILIGSTIFLKSHTKTINCEKGERISHVLPDGSTVEMNAASTMSYNPYWWNFKRELSLEGEAFFKVEKGQKFKVISNNGITEVLGTSFNIYSRKDNYKVFCETGKVKVSSTQNNVELIITPGEMAILDNKLGKIESINTEKVIDWKNNKFNFSSEPLTNVIEEIERQYNINIELELKNPSEYIYSGYFPKSTHADSTLDLICQSLNLKFVKQGKSEYKVLQNK